MICIIRRNEMEQGERIKKWDMGAAVGTGF